MISNQYKENLNKLLQNTADLSLKRKAFRIMMELDPKKSDKILDLGCGDGYYILLATQLGDFFSVGLEYDSSNLKAAERNFNNLKIKFQMLNKWHKNIKMGRYLIQ